MKNTLAENMLRFGVKNLTVEQTAALATAGKPYPKKSTRPCQRKRLWISSLSVDKRPTSHHLQHNSRPTREQSAQSKSGDRHARLPTTSSIRPGPTT